MKFEQGKEKSTQRKAGKEGGLASREVIQKSEMRMGKKRSWQEEEKIDETKREHG